jgi:hypothetical protein
MWRCASKLTNLDASKLALERGDALRAVRESGSLDGDGGGGLVTTLS